MLRHTFVTIMLAAGVDLRDVQDVPAERGFGFASDGMAAMERSAEDLPPPYFGDYPHGAYWSASHQDSSVKDDDEAEDFTVEGTRLRVMWDEGAGPLWGDDGLLPDDPAWLRQALGLSDSLIAELLAWVRDMDAARERGQAQALLDHRALQLTERLQTEVGSRFRVRFHR